MSESFSVHSNPTVSVQISSSEGPTKFIPVEKNISRNESVRAVKGRLEVITSADSSTMTVKVFDRNDKFICILDDDEKLLGSYHIDDGMRLHVEDEFRLRRSLENDSSVEKFVMPEEEYKKRTEKWSSSDHPNSSGGGLSLACPGKKGKLSDLKHKGTKPRRPRTVDEVNGEKSTPTNNNRADETKQDNSATVKKNLFVRKTQSEIKSKTSSSSSTNYSPNFVESSLVSPLNRLGLAPAKADEIAMKSTLRATAEEFTPSKRIPIIDPSTNKEIVLDDIDNYVASPPLMALSGIDNLLYQCGYVDPPDPEEDVNNSGDGDPVHTEISKTIDYIVRQLLVNPGSLDDLMKLFKDNIRRWGVDDPTLEYILTCIVDTTVALNNFAYLGAKICVHLDRIVSKIRPSMKIRTLVLTASEHKFSELEGWLMDEETRNTAHSFIMFLAELYDQLLVENARIKALWEALCGTYILLMKDPNSFNIRCLCKVLKLTGRNIYQDNRLMLSGIIAQLEDINRSQMFDSQTAAMLSSVIGLANSHWGLGEEIVNGISAASSTTRDEGRGAEMYGPDGKLLSFEEKKFLDDNCLELVEYEEPFDLQDSYADSDDGMDEEMQEAFEQFLLSVPEAR